MWIPSGEDYYGGWNDRHAVLSREAAEIYMRRWDFIVGGEVLWIDPQMRRAVVDDGLRTQDENLVRNVLEHFHLGPARRFPAVQYLGCCVASTAPMHGQDVERRGRRQLALARVRPSCHTERRCHGGRERSGGRRDRKGCKSPLRPPSLRRPTPPSLGSRRCQSGENTARRSSRRCTTRSRSRFPARGTACAHAPTPGAARRDRGARSARRCIQGAAHAAETSRFPQAAVGVPRVHGFDVGLSLSLRVNSRRKVNCK